MIRVLHAIDTLAAGGAERVMVDLANHQRRAGIAPVACVSRSNIDTASRLHQSIPLEVLDRRFTLDPRGFWRLSDLIRKHRIDLVHAHGYSTASFAAVAKLLTRSSWPLLAHAHGSGPVPRTFKLTLPAVNAVLAVSGAVATAIRTSSPASDVLLFENAIDLAMFESDRAAEWGDTWNPRRKFTGLVLANVRPVKDLVTLLEALGRSLYRDEISLLIVGSLADADYVKECQAIVASLQLAAHVTWVGAQLNINPYLDLADFAIFSSTRETGPLALLEYMGAGLPFVSTRVGEVAEACVAAGVGEFVPRENPEALSRALDRLLSLTADERRVRGQAGRTLVERRFDIRIRVDELSKVYGKLLGTTEEVSDTESTHELQPRSGRSPSQARARNF